MESLRTIERVLERLSQRRRLIAGIRTVGNLLFWGALAVLISVIAYKVLPISPRLPVWVTFLTVLLTLGGFLWRFCQRPSLL